MRSQIVNARAREPVGFRKLPWCSLGFVGAALAVSFTPEAADLLQFDRVGVGKGELWRLVTGQLVHWTPRMALVDLGVVLLVGTLIERRSRSMLVRACLAGLLIIGLGIHSMAPQIMVYRGASGLATTLFVLLALDLLRAREPLATRGLGALALCLFAAKLIWETGSTGGFVAGSFPEGVAVLPLAHLLGGLAAVALFGMSLHIGGTPPHASCGLGGMGLGRCLPARGKKR